MTQLEQNFLEAATRFCRDHYIRDNHDEIEINWEQRRYEIAKDSLTVLMSDVRTCNQILYNCILDKNNGTLSCLSRTAVVVADALIEELKK